MGELEWFSTKRNVDGSFSILVPKNWPENVKHKALDAIDAGIQAGVDKEQERIIKLLEDSMAICDKNKEPEGCEACYGQRDAIALIKGEQK